MTSVLERIRDVTADAVTAARPQVSGQVEAVRGLSVQVRGLSVRVGDVVVIGSQTPTPAEVVAVSVKDGEQLATCLPLGPVSGIGVSDRVTTTGGPLRIGVGAPLLGLVLDGLGRPLDGSPLPSGLNRVTVDSTPPDSMTRDRVDQPLPLGVRAIDTLVPLGRGQRMGIFAGSGVGKSSLLSMISRGTQAEVKVIALVGERGREVREFIEDDLGPDGLRNSVVIVATSDQPPMVRLRAAFVATRIAEWFRDDGRDVLLMMDSLTRLAFAQREIGLSAGEPPATRGYPPSVFAMLPQLLERAGSSSLGSITGLYTVLVEGDDHNEPIADTARSILDGHIVLDRRLAASGHFPSIEVLSSVSRVANAILTDDQRSLVRETRQLLDARAEVRELVQIGAYVRGTNPTRRPRARSVADARGLPASGHERHRDLGRVLGRPGIRRPVGPGGGDPATGRWCRVTAKWLNSLMRARQIQEDHAARELAEAERRARRATAYVRHNAERIETLSNDEAEMTVPAFIAAAVALQAAAATHAAAVASAKFAYADSDLRRAGLHRAARARLTAEELHENAHSIEAARRARLEQREHDEIASSMHRQHNPEVLP